MSMFRSGRPAALLSAALLSASVLATPALAESKYVAVTAIVEHPALNAIRDGVKEGLKAQGFPDVKFTYESAQGSPATAAQIARKLVGEKPDAIVAIATPSAQAVATATRDIPLIFSAVTDPVSAKLVPSLDPSGTNVTGLSDMLPLDEHLDLIRAFLPNAKKIGVPYNPGESNAVSLINALKKAGPAAGFEIVTAAANKSSDVLAASQSLVGKVDAIYTLTDNTIVSALESVVKVGNDNKIPVFAADIDSVDRGAVAAVGFDYYDLGIQTATVVARVLKGEKPGSIATRTASSSKLSVNKKAAAAQGVTIPDAVLKRATKVID